MKTFNIHIDHYAKLGIASSIREIVHTNHAMFGEIFYNEEFANPCTSEILDSSNCAFSFEYNGKYLQILPNNSNSGRIIQSILETYPENIKFVPRIIVTQTNAGLSLDFSTIDAIINNKEIWDRF